MARLRHAERIVYERHAGAARAPLGAAYRRREPERTILYGVVQDHLQSFLAGARAEHPDGHGLPSFIEREFTRYLECGILAHGFARVRCDDCGHDRLVAFSCRGRAICPSCNARRMHDTAAHLVDRVLPCGATYRQWVLSLPRWVRFKLAYQPKLVSRVLEIFVRAIFAYQRRRSRRHGIVAGRPGSVTFIQRFGSALNLNIHFHVLVPDGVFTERAGEICFVALGAPTNDEVEALARKVARRTLALMERVDEPPQTIAEDSADPYAAAFKESLQRVIRFTVDDLPVQRKHRAAFLQGFSIHANVSVGESKRDALERLCRYGARPPIALGRLSSTSGGRIVYRVKHHAPGESGILVLTPLELLGKLSALIPPPRSHGVRYHGVFASNAKWRSRVVPLVRPAPGASDAAALVASTATITPWVAARPRRLDWAALLMRVFKIDVLECDQCGGGRMRVLAFLTDPGVTEAILAHLGLPATVPGVKPARAPPILQEVERRYPIRPRRGRSAPRRRHLTTTAGPYPGGATIAHCRTTPNLPEIQFVLAA